MIVIAFPLTVWIGESHLPAMPTTVCYRQLGVKPMNQIQSGLFSSRKTLLPAGGLLGFLPAGEWPLGKVLLADRAGTEIRTGGLG